MSYLTVQDVSKHFVTPGGRRVEALAEVSFAVDRGIIVAVVGHNGSGKTTLLNCIRASLPLDGGFITINGHSAEAASVRVASVFQDVSAGVVESMTATENLALAMAGHDRGFWRHLPGAYYREAIRSFLAEAGLLVRFRAFESTAASELSGGQRQQLAIMMAMMRKPSVLLLDEFIANLDPTVKEEVLGWTKAWITANDVTALMVTHDLAIAEQWCDRVLELRDGRVVRFEKAAGVTS